MEKLHAPCEKIAENYSHKSVIHGDSTNYRKLQEEDIDLCRTFVAGTKDDSLNLTMSLVAKQMGAEHVILYSDVKLSFFLTIRDSSCSFV